MATCRQHPPIVPCPSDPFLYRNAAQLVVCPEGRHGPNTLVPAGCALSQVSQADADQQALAFAELNQRCAWLNTEQSASCASDWGTHDFESETVGPGFEFSTGAGGWPDSAFNTSTTPAGTVASYVSQADADQQALDQAEAALTCLGPVLPLRTFWFVEEFGIDDIESYPIGELGSLWGGYCWASAVQPFSPIDYQMAFDDIESYPTGTITAATAGGSNWSSNGSFFTP